MSSERRGENDGVLHWAHRFTLNQLSCGSREYRYQILPDNLRDFVVHSIHSSIRCLCSADSSQTVACLVPVLISPLSPLILSSSRAGPWPVICINAAQWLPKWNQANKHILIHLRLSRMWRVTERDFLLQENQDHRKHLPRLHFNIFSDIYKDSKCKRQWRMLSRVGHL